MKNYLAIKKIFQGLIDYNDFEISEGDEYIITYHGNEDFSKELYEEKELFQALLHEYIYQELEGVQVDEIEQLPEGVRNGLQQEMEDLKREYKSITGQEFKEKSNNEFGKILKDVRLHRKLTKAQLGRNICDARTILRIENGDIDCPSELLEHFSAELHFDFQDFHTEITYCHTLDAYLLVQEFFDAVVHQDIKRVMSVMESMEQSEEFLAGRNLQMLYYAKALVTTMVEQDFKKSKELCLKGIAADGKTFDENIPFKENYTHIEQTLIHSYGLNLMKLGEYEQAKKIFEFLLKFLEDYPKTQYRHCYKYSEKEKDVYMHCIENLAANSYWQKDYEQSLSYVQKGFEFSYKHNHARYILVMLQKEFCYLCYLERYEEAVETYNTCLFIAKKMENENLIESLKSDYQELIKIFK